jgi:hypothetical protein
VRELPQVPAWNPPRAGRCLNSLILRVEYLLSDAGLRFRISCISSGELKCAIQKPLLVLSSLVIFFWSSSLKIWRTSASSSVPLMGGMKMDWLLGGSCALGVLSAAGAAGVFSSDFAGAGVPLVGAEG